MACKNTFVKKIYFKAEVINAMGDILYWVKNTIHKEDKRAKNYFTLNNSNQNIYKNQKVRNARRILKTTVIMGESYLQNLAGQVVKLHNIIENLNHKQLISQARYKSYTFFPSPDGTFKNFIMYQTTKKISINSKYYIQPHSLIIMQGN